MIYPRCFTTLFFFFFETAYIIITNLYEKYKYKATAKTPKQKNGAAEVVTLLVAAANQHTAKKTKNP